MVRENPRAANEHAELIPYLPHENFSLLSLISRPSYVVYLHDTRGSAACFVDNDGKDREGVLLILPSADLHS